MTKEMVLVVKNASISGCVQLGEEEKNVPLSHHFVV